MCHLILACPLLSPKKIDRELKCLSNFIFVKRILLGSLVVIVLFRKKKTSEIFTVFVLDMNIFNEKYS